MYKVGLIGSGSLGTALAQILSINVDEVILYTRRLQLCETINKTHYNTEYYPNVKLNDNIHATNDYDDLKDCKIIFLTIPSSAFRNTLIEIKNIISEETILVTTAKGIEYPSLKTMGEVIEEYSTNDYVALSGPNFASEIILNLPTITNIASNNPEYSQIIKDILINDQFKVKIIDDLKGVEICGVIKNINAIANGLCEGMTINENAKYSVLTKGINETMAIIEAVGGKNSTILEYCGFGDMVLTSTSIESRNHTLGILYGQKIIVDENATGVLFEGKNSIKAIKEICDNNNLNCSIVNFVYDVIIKQTPPKLAFNTLWKNIE